MVVGHTGGTERLRGLWSWPLLLSVRFGEIFRAVYPGVVMGVSGRGYYGWRMGDRDGKGNEKKRG